METYFAFEQDFVEQQVRCIPMVVRFKLDAVGVKLTLADWSNFSLVERTALSTRPCDAAFDRAAYRSYLSSLIKKYSGKEPALIPVDEAPAWRGHCPVPEELRAKAAEFGWSISPEEWQVLSELQRFALLKLCRPGHENRNFPKAMAEFRFRDRRVG